MKLLYFGDGAWGTRSLERLVKDGHEIVGVVLRARPTDSGLADLARAGGAPLFQPADVNAPAFVEEARATGADLFLSVSYDQILRAGIRDAAPQRIINFHAGKLPLYRGRNILNWALINGESEIGITAHAVDDGIDTGDLLLQRVLPVGPDETYGELLARVVASFPDLVSEAVALVASGSAVYVAQDHRLGTYFPARGAGDEWIDWSEPSKRIHDKVRAITDPGPGALVLIAGTRVRIWATRLDRSAPAYIATTGVVVGRSSRGALVKTGDATLTVTEAQHDGGVRGAPEWKIGTRLYGGVDARLAELEAKLAKLGSGGA